MEINVKDYLSEGLNCVQAAVNACDIGRVIVPAGIIKTGKIHLKSNVELYLEEGAVLSFSDVMEDYLPVVFTRWEGIECYNYSPLIYAVDCENIRIAGKGTLLGNGQAWWPWKKLQQQAAEQLVYAEADGIPVEQRVFGTREAALRPSFIQFIRCKDIAMEDFTIKDGPQWTIHPVYCDNVSVKNVTVDSKGPNTDGLNPDSCNHVIIEGCHFDTGDDCIAINSGMNEDGLRVGRPCTDITVKDCVMTGGHGAVVIGSSVSGSIHNVHASNCKISNVERAIRIKSMRGRGGKVSDIHFDNFEISNVTHQAVQITMFYEASTVIPRTDTPSEFDDISISNMYGTCTGAGIEAIGLAEMNLTNLSLKNINLKVEKEALTVKDVASISMENVSIE